MLNKEYFFKFMKSYENFEYNINKISNILFGNNDMLYESNLVDIVNEMFDLFIKSHFTESGIDLIYWWKFEDVEKVIYTNEGKDIEASVETIEELWDYMDKYKNDYIL